MNTNTRKHSLKTRVLSVLLSALTVLSALFSLPITAEAMYANFNYKTSYSFKSSFSVSYKADRDYSTTQGTSIFRFYVNQNMNSGTNNLSYCVAPGGSIYSSSDIQQGDSGSVNYWKEACRRNSVVQKYAGRVLYYGYGGDGDVTSLSGLSIDDRYVATQILLWQLVTNDLDEDLNQTYKINYVGKLNKADLSNFNKAYNAIINACKQHTKIPNFSKRSAARASTYTLKYNPEHRRYEYITPADTSISKEDFGQIKWTVNNSNINFYVDKDNRSITLWSYKPVTSEVTLTGTRVNAGEEKVGNVIWGKWDPSKISTKYSQIQVLISHAEIDPIYAYFKVKTEGVGSLKVEKTFEDYNGNATDPAVYNMHFLVKNSKGYYVSVKGGSNGIYTYDGTYTQTSAQSIYNSTNYYMTLTKTANTKYSFTLQNLPPDTYTVVEYKELSDDKTAFYQSSGYEVKGQNSQTAKVISNTVQSVKFVNTPIAIKLTKNFKGGWPSEYKLARFVLNTSNNGDVYFKHIATNRFVVVPASQMGTTGVSPYLYFDIPSSMYVYGLPRKNLSNELIVYTLRETNDGSGKSGQWYTFTANSGFNQGGFKFTIASTETAKNPHELKADNTPIPGKLDIIKIFKYTRNGQDIQLSDSNISTYVKNKTMQDLYDDLTFEVRDKSNNLVHFARTQSGVEGNYKVVASGGITRVKLGADHQVHITGLTYGSYSVEEFTTLDFEPTEKVIQHEVNRDSIKTPVKFEFENSKSDESSLKVFKYFQPSLNENSITLNSSDVRDAVTFYIRRTDILKGSGMMLFVTATQHTDDNGRYYYTPTGSGHIVYADWDDIEGAVAKLEDQISDNNATAKQTRFKVTPYNSIAGFTGGTVDRYYFSLEGLQSASYEIIEKISPHTAVGSRFVVEKPLNDNVLIQTKSTTISSTRTLSFRNIMEPGNLQIVKYSEDDDVQRTFRVRSYFTRKDGSTKDYNEYETTTELKGTDSNGKTYGAAILENLPVIVYEPDYTGQYNFFTLQYEVEEVDTPDRYLVPEKQSIQIKANATADVNTVVFENKLRKATVEINKKKQTINGTELYPFEGIVFELRNNYNTEVLTATTDASGHASFENLVAQRYDPEQKEIVDIQYTLVEKKNKVNENFVLNEDQVFSFDLTNEELLKTFEPVNTEKEGSVILSKLNYDTKKPITDAQFAVQSIENGKVVATINMESDGKGNYYLNSLPMGTYRVIETVTPDNCYVISSNTETFELTEDGQVIAAYTDENGITKYIDTKDEKYIEWFEAQDADNTQSDYNYYNYPAKVDIQIYKVDKTNTQKYLSGAVFELINDVNKNGILDDDEKDNIFGTLTETTDKDKHPVYTINDVSIGNYLLFEKKTPDNYAIIGTEYTPITIDNTVLSTTDRTVSALPVQHKQIIKTIENKPVEGSISIVKFDSDTQELLSGAEFTVYKDLDGNGKYDEGKDVIFDGKDVDGKTVAKGISSTGVLAEVSGKPGHYEASGIPAGSYVVKETKTPEINGKSYQPNENDYGFIIINDGDHVDLYDIDFDENQDAKPLGVTINGVFYPGIANKPTQTTVVVYKHVLKNLIDKDNIEQDEIKSMSLMNHKGEIMYTVSIGNGLTIDTTTKTGEADFGTIKSGNYRLIINEDVSYIYAVLIQEKKGEAKIDLSQVKAPLKNVTFDLYKDGEKISTRTTNNIGLVSFTNLQTGDYVIKEHTPSGYETISDTTFTVEASDNNKTKYIQIQNTPVPGYLYIAKDFKDEPDRQDKSGVKFHVSGNTIAGNPVNFTAKTGYNGTITRKVDQGTYVITEDAEYCRTHYYRQPQSQTITVTKDNSAGNPATVTFENLYKRANIELYKYDKDYPDVKLHGAQFEIYQSDKKVGTLTEDTEGHYQYVAKDADTVKKSGLILGLYTVKETVPPYGFALDTNVYTVDLTKTADGSTYNLETTPGQGFLNTPVTVNISVYKQDKLDKKYISGAVFNLYNAVTDELIGELTETKDANDKPIYKYSKGLRYGRYYIQEVSVPKEYVLDTSKRYFTVDENTVKDLTGKTVITLDELQATVLEEQLEAVQETPVMGSIIIRKRDKATMNLLSGAEFTMYNDTNGNGKYDAGTDTVYTGSKNGIIPETNEQGVYTLNNIRFGTYFVKETKSPPGFIENKTIYKAVIDTNQQQCILVDVDKNGNALDGIMNESFYNDVEVFKYDVRDLSYLVGKTLVLKNDQTSVEKKADNTIVDFGTVQAGRYTISVKGENKIRSVINVEDGNHAIINLSNVQVPLSGAQFTIYDKATNKPVAESDQTSNPVYSGDDGYAMFTHLRYGEYYIQETKAPANHIRSEEIIDVVVSKTLSKPQSFTMNNVITNGYYKIVKKSPDDGKIEGIKFSLKGTTATGEPREYTNLITDKDGVIKERIELGKYTVTELDVPKYYQQVSPQIVTVTKSNTVDNPAVVTFTNTYKRGNIEVLKVEGEKDLESDSNSANIAELKGAEFRITGKDVNGQTVTYTLQYVGNSTYKYLANDADIATKGLIYGDYTLEETKAPYGFVRDTNVYSFSITEDGKTERVDTKAGIGFINQPIKVNIFVVKESKDHTPLKGATFELYKDVEPYNECNNSDILMGTLNDNKDGIYYYDELRYGHYCIKEVKAPEGYLVNETPLFFEVKGYDDVTAQEVNLGISQKVGTIVEEKITAPITVKKIDKETQETLSGAIFTLYEDSDENNEFDVAKDAKIGTLTETDVKGVYTSESMPYGTYFVIETKQPEGFEQNNTVYTAIVSENETPVIVADVDSDGNTLDGVYNTPVRNNVEVFKYDVRDLSYLKGQAMKLYNAAGKEIKEMISDTTTVDFGTVDAGRYYVRLVSTDKTIASIYVQEKGNAVLDLTKATKPLSGAEFTIYQKDGKTPVNDPDNTKNPVVTGEDGYAVFTQLRYGEYVIKETKAPANHDLSEDVIKVNVTDSTSTYSYTMNNNETTRFYKIIKTADDGKVEGVRFSVVGETANGVPVNIEVKTNANGEFLDNIKLGTYTVTELDKYDYYRPQQSKTITVTDANTESNPATVKFENIHKRGNVQVLKFDSEYPDTVMDDAEFTIYGKDINGNDVSYKLTYVGNNTYKYLADDSKIKTEGLIYGDYTLKETKAPTGFIKDDGTYKFSIKEDGKTVSVENQAGKGFANDAIKVDIKLVKVEKDTRTQLKGAIFELYKDNEPYGEADSNDTKITNLKDNGDGTYKTEALRYGHYYVKETKAPTGYNVNSTIQYFEIKGYDGATLQDVQNHLVKELETVEETPVTGSVLVRKFNKETMELLSGATFTMYEDTNKNGQYDKDTDKVYEGSESGQIPESATKGVYTLDKIRYGTYFVIETKQPEGFEKNDDVYTVKVDKQGVQRVIANTQTSNTSNDKIGVVNTPIRNDVEIFKYDIRDLSYLKGQTLVLFSGDKQIATAKSDTVSYDFGTVEAGRYLVRVSGQTAIRSVINVTAEDQTAKLDLTKVQVPLQGAEFTIYNKDGKTAVNDAEHTNNPIVTDETGYAKFTQLLYGEYVIKETKAPANHDILENDIPVVIDDSVSTHSYSVNNTATKAFYKIVKTSDDGKIADVKFSLTGTTATGEPVNFPVLKTNEKGEIINKIELGTYTITELEVADCYRPVKSQTITVTAENTESNPATAKFENIHKRGNVELLKKDPKYPNTEMKDAEFTIYGKDLQGKDVSYKLTYVGNNTYKYLVDDSKIKNEGLIYGDYTLKETKTPYGFVKDTQTYKFSITEDGKTVRVYNEPGQSFINNRIEVDISLVKREETLQNTYKAPAKLLPGATFELYRYEPIMMQDGTEAAHTNFDADILLGQLTDNGDGSYSYADLCYGNYYIKEVNAPEGYNVNNDPVFFEVSGYDNVTLKEVDNTIVKDIGYVDDKPITAPIEIKKFDAETQELLSDAVFTLYADSNGNNKFDESDAEVAVFEETTTGIYVADNVRYGTYFIKETKVPEGFEQNSKVYTATVKSQDKTVKVSDAQFGGNANGVENTPIRNNAEIFKYDVRDMSYLKGTALELKNADGQVVANTTSKTVDYNFGKVDAGRYTVTANGKTIAVINMTETGDAVLKLSSVQVPLKGAEFTIYNKATNEPVNDSEHTQNPVVTGEDGYAVFTDLLYGEYVIKETKAPANHDKSKEEIDVVIKDSVSTYSFSMNNNETKRYYKIVKTSDDGVIEGVKFSVVGTTKNGMPVNIPEVKTDANGEFLGKIELGTYTITELDVPDRYRPVASQTVEVTTTNTKENPATVTFENIHKRGNVEVIKFNPDFPDVEIPDAIFTVKGKDLDGKDVSYELTYVGNNTYRYVENAEDIKTNGLIYGDYTLEETKEPEGFLRDTNVYEFKITEDNVTVPVETDIGEGFKNDYIKGSLRIIKLDPTNEQPLSGAKFVVYNKATDQPVTDVLVTDDNGEISVKNLIYGHYYIKEIEAPKDYQLLEDVIDFDIIEHDFEVKRVIDNTPHTGSLIIHKQSEDNIVEHMKFRVQGEPIKGYPFDIIAETDADGIARVDNLIVGKYTVTEIETPERYLQPEPQTAIVLADEITKLVQKVTLDPEFSDDTEDTTTEKVAASDNATQGNEPNQPITFEPETTTNEITEVTFDNVLKKGTVVVIKVDEEYPDHKLTGAEFTIYGDTNENGEYDEGDTEIGQLIEESEGTYIYENLVWGKYLIKETKAPENYKIDENYYAFSITEDKQTETISNIEGDCFINTPIKGIVQITKVDKDYPDNKLTGAEFEIYVDVNGNGKHDEEDELLTKMTESENEQGTYYSEPLRVGKYLVKETKAPQYYEVDDNYYAFEIVSEDTVIVSNVEAEVKEGTEITEENKCFVDKHKDVDVVITKVDVSTAEVIPNCEIAILDSDKKIIIKDVTNDKGEVWFKLQPGKYFYQEIKAPEGYILNEELHPFEIKTDTTIFKDTLTNTKKPVTPPDTPRTGDTTTPAIVITLVIAALLSAGVIVITFRRRKKRNSK